MALSTANRTLGPKADPQEISNLRESNYDMQDEFGQPVILKHKWNELDVREGRAKICPLHNKLYQEDLDTCPYCFGTGILGGYDDGILIYSILADAREDTFRLTDQGVLLHDRSPQAVFPWVPIVGDDDLIITVELDNVGEIQNTYDRYTLRQSQPGTMRGPGFSNTRRSRPFTVSQQAQVDIVPYASILWKVPIVFDYDSVPVIDTALELAIRITGSIEQFITSTALAARVAVSGTKDSAEIGARITGIPGGTNIFID